MAGSPVEFMVERGGGGELLPAVGGAGVGVGVEEDVGDDGEGEAEGEVAGWGVDETQPFTTEEEEEDRVRDIRSRAPSRTDTTPPPAQKQTTFTLHLTPSTQNHAAYLSRQHYHAAFHPNTRTIAGQDLEKRVPRPGLADLQLGVGEVPLRVRNARAEGMRREGRGWWKKSLGEVWGEGVREREGEEERMGGGREGAKGGEGNVEGVGNGEGEGTGVGVGVVTKYAYSVSLVPVPLRWEQWGVVAG